MHLFGKIKRQKERKGNNKRAVRCEMCTNNNSHHPYVCSELLLISEYDLANGTLIILVIHRLVISSRGSSFFLTHFVRQLTISLLMCRIYRSNLVIRSASCILSPFLTHFSSSSMILGHSLFTTYDLLTIARCCFFFVCRVCTLELIA